MNLKNILKSFKLNESTISMMLGALVIVVVGLLVVNYFRSTEPGSTFPEGLTDESQDQSGFPKNHQVAEGETLWDISEEYYGTGFNWVDIAEANGLDSADVIEEGQTLIIPSVETIAEDEETPSEDELADAEATAQPTMSPTPSPTPSPSPTPTPTPEPEQDEPVENNISGETYVVQRGDNLWDIAVRAYGNGYRWTDIAEANDLANPNIIHAGNEFVLPR